MTIEKGKDIIKD